MNTDLLVTWHAPTRRLLLTSHCPDGEAIRQTTLTTLQPERRRYQIEAVPGAGCACGCQDGPPGETPVDVQLRAALVLVRVMRDPDSVDDDPGDGVLGWLCRQDDFHLEIPHPVLASLRQVIGLLEDRGWWNPQPGPGGWVADLPLPVPASHGAPPKPLLN